MDQEAIDQDTEIEYVLTETYISGKPKESAFWWTSFFIVLLAGMSVWHWELLKQVGSSFLLADELTYSAPSHLYRLLSSTLIHADLGHLLSNLIIFIYLSYFIVGYFGVSVLFAGFGFGAFINLIVLNQAVGAGGILGASGVCYWLAGFWLISYFLIDLRKSLKQRLLRSLGVALAVFMPSSAFDPHISYLSHFLGFVLGLGSGLFFYVLFRTKIKSKEVFVALREP